jgi:hypothetical protein
MTFNLDNHYDCPLYTLGLSASSGKGEIEDAIDRELDDLEAAYGDEHGVTREELREFLTKWVDSQETPQERVNKATSLRDLCDTLKEIEVECQALDTRLEDVVDICALPTFGGEDPVDTSGVWSWDEDEVLFADSGWYCTKRDPDAWYSRRSA